MSNELDNLLDADKENLHPIKIQMKSKTPLRPTLAAFSMDFSEEEETTLSKRSKFEVKMTNITAKDYRQKTETMKTEKRRSSQNQSYGTNERSRKRQRDDHEDRSREKDRKREKRIENQETRRRHNSHEAERRREKNDRMDQIVKDERETEYRRRKEENVREERKRPEEKAKQDEKYKKEKEYRRTKYEEPERKKKDEEDRIMKKEREEKEEKERKERKEKEEAWRKVEDEIARRKMAEEAERKINDEKERRMIKEQEEAEEKKRKEEEKKIARRKEEEEAKRIKKQEEMNVPQYEVIKQCQYYNGSKEKTKSYECICHETGRNCSDDTCYNRRMNIECPKSCRTRCRNQRFARREYASVEPFNTRTAKGCGLRTIKKIFKNDFIIEYIGDVLNKKECEMRKTIYSNNANHKHYYFCKVGKYTIDATVRGNASRFANHSCDPNARCTKWAVPKTPGDVPRVGFFALKDIEVGEEITFDYQFVNYGRNAQKCICGSSKCTSTIGEKLQEIEDIDDVILTESVNDEEETINLEKLNRVSRLERLYLIDEMLESLQIRSKKCSEKVITIASRMTDHAQREYIIKKIFSNKTKKDVQEYYIKKGMTLLMARWLEEEDHSYANLKLVKLILTVLKEDIFLFYAKSNALLLAMPKRWKDASLDTGMDTQVVVASLVSCTVDLRKSYKDVCEKKKEKIAAAFEIVKKLASELDTHWFIRSVSYVIPKKHSPCKVI